MKKTNNILYQNELIDDGNLSAIGNEIEKTLRKALGKSADFNNFLNELDSLILNWPPDKIALLLTAGTFRARLQGQQEFNK